LVGGFILNRELTVDIIKSPGIAARADAMVIKRISKLDRSFFIVDTTIL